MPISLNVHRDKLSARLQILTSGFNRHLTTASSMRLLDRAAVREGYVSSLWQAWCRFFRSVILTSATGGLTSSGRPITCMYSMHSEAELLFIAKQIANRAHIRRVRAISGSHQEPTWGDIDKALLISNGMGLSNSQQLLSALSLASTIKVLQLCRNATAHLGPVQLAELGATRVPFDDTKLLHPTDACFWIDPNTCGYLWDTWIDEIALVADYACR